MSFASEIREEICKIDIENVCCARAELVGLVCFGASFKSDEIKLRTENIVVAQRFFDLIKFLYKIDINIKTTESGIHYAFLCGNDVIKILRDMKLGGIPIHIDREIVRNECCKASLLRGIFLGGGSMIDPVKGYHIELVSSHFSINKDLKPVFEYFEIYPKTINRNGN
ncbi:MAG: DNA-binding protein WhiA, partial [Clostridia bacterium]|nr:DNA-binding protein WhiA [Clostridia bacterium]